MNILIFVLLLVIFIILSAFFSGAETALTKLSKIKVKHWIYTQSSKSEAWANWLARPQELITTILVGNTCVNVFFSSIAALLATELIPWKRPERVQIVAGLIAFLVLLIFGEIVPKMFCLQNPERISSIVLGPLSLMSRFFASPITKLLGLLGRVFRVFREPAAGRVSALTLDEIRAIVLDSSSLEGLDKDHREMMQKVLNLHRITVSQIMTPWKNVDFLALEEALSGGEKLERFIDRWVESGRTRVPVVSGHSSRILGYMYVKDMLVCIARNKKPDPALCKKWVKPLPAIFPDRKVGDVLDIFRFGSPMACVYDRMGFPLGIVTLEDVLEEFVGEIMDEYDLEEKIRTGSE